MFVSIRAGRGTYVSVGSTVLATVLLFVAAAVGLVQLYFALLGLVLTVILVPLCIYLESRRTKREFENAL